MKRLSDYFMRRAAQAFVPVDRNWQDEMSSEKLQQALAPFVESNSNMNKFDVANNLVWVCGSHPPIRPVLTFEKMKGGVLWPFYGISADFVPVIVGRRAILRTGIKATKLDIRIDPRDHKSGVHFFSGPAVSLADMERTLPKVLKRAVPFWSRHQTVESMAAAVKYEEGHTALRPGPGVSNYVQASFARPFLLAAAKETELADSYWQRFEVECSLDSVGLRKAKEQYLKVRSGHF
jgi:hypothetical protein